MTKYTMTYQQESEDRARRRTGVLDRTFAILDCFTSDEPTLTLTQITRRTGLAASTTSRLLKSLCEHGALIRERSGGYSIGPRLMEIAQFARPMLSIREAASPILDDLNRTTDQHIQLGTLDGAEMVILDRREGKHPIPVYYHIGDRLPLAPTAAGRTLLAYAGPGIIGQIVNTGTFTWPTWQIPRPSSDELMASLALIRQRRVAVLQTPGASVHSVAAPIFGRTNAVIAAVSIVLSAGSTSLERYVPLIKAGATAISRRVTGPKTSRILPPWDQA